MDRVHPAEAGDPCCIRIAGGRVGRGGIVARSLVEPEGEGRLERKEVVEVRIDRERPSLPGRADRRLEVTIAGDHQARHRPEPGELAGDLVELGAARPSADRSPVTTTRSGSRAIAESTSDRSARRSSGEPSKWKSERWTIRVMRAARGRRWVARVARTASAARSTRWPTDLDRRGRRDPGERRRSCVPIETSLQPSLEQSVALAHVGRQPEVEPGLIWIGVFRAPRERCLGVHVEEEHGIGRGHEREERVQPRRFDAARLGAGHRCPAVAIGDHDKACAQRRPDDLLDPLGEVRRVEQRRLGRVGVAIALRAADQVAAQERTGERGPRHAPAGVAKVLLETPDVGRAAGAIDALEHEQDAGLAVRGRPGRRHGEAGADGRHRTGRVVIAEMSAAPSGQGPWRDRAVV